jgi:hypothetical protein
VKCPVAARSGARSRFVGLDSTLERDLRADGLPTPPLEKIRQPVLPYREAIASAKLVPEHQHDQRGRESFFASQGDLYPSFSLSRENVTSRMPGDTNMSAP